LIYKNRQDSTLGRPNFTLEGPLPGHYVVVAPGAAPSSLKALLRDRKRIFVREETARTDEPCTTLLLDRIGEREAKLHHDEVDERCSVRYFARLEYEPSDLGAASIDYRYDGQPRILRGCAGTAFGIALCGWPVLLIVAADDRRIQFVDAHAHMGGTWTLHAYDPNAVIEWYFDAGECSRAPAKVAREGCGR
jgi:hypothetical protein